MLDVSYKYSKVGILKWCIGSEISSWQFAFKFEMTQRRAERDGGGRWTRSKLGPANSPPYVALLCVELSAAALI